MARVQAIDPSVSRAKFDREVALFRSAEEDHRRRGWWLLRAEFPEVLVVFATEKTKVPVVVFGALLDFSDYDFRPPSVRLVNPFTLAPYRFAELPSPLPRAVGPEQTPELVRQFDVRPELQSLMQPAPEGSAPFLCVVGVREYHEHPAHTGDSWLLHRGSGRGTLNHILDVLYRYGVQPIVGFQVQVQLVPQITGLIHGAIAS